MSPEGPHRYVMAEEAPGTATGAARRYVIRDTVTKGIAIECRTPCAGLTSNEALDALSRLMLEERARTS